MTHGVQRTTRSCQLSPNHTLAGFHLRYPSLSSTNLLGGLGKQKPVLQRRCKHRAPRSHGDKNLRDPFLVEFLQGNRSPRLSLKETLPPLLCKLVLVCKASGNSRRGFAEGGHERSGAAGVCCDEMLELLHRPLRLLTVRGSAAAPRQGSAWKALCNPWFAFLDDSQALADPVF